MFENMTKRERYLAVGVAILIPIAILFMGFIGWITSYQKNDLDITRIEGEIEAQQKIVLEAKEARNRRAYYRSVSLPAEKQEAEVNYAEWLRETLNKSGLSYRKLSDAAVRKGTFRDKDNALSPVYTEYMFKTTATGTLEQLTTFLHEFYSLNVLHRIGKIEILPKSLAKTGAKAKIRSGELTIQLQFDALSLSKADPNRDFVSDKRPLEISLEDYNKQILTRNIFGPANNPPFFDSFPSPRSITFSTGSTIKFPITGNDADTNDKLKIELLESASEEATLAVSSEKPGKTIVNFESPMLPVGEHKFKTRVTDNGTPPKSTVAEWVVKINKKKNSQPTFATKSFKVESGEEVELIIKATDSDSDDVLTIKVVDQEVYDGLADAIKKYVKPIDLEDAAIATIEDQPRSIKFTCPALETGDYKIPLHVIDNAETPKELAYAIKLEVMAPKFLEAEVTEITSIISRSSGIEAWIHVRQRGELIKVKKGDTFDLDRKKWTVESISADDQTLVLNTDGKRRTYKRGDFLLPALNEEVIAAEPKAEEVAEPESESESATE